jgi:predicted CXXCH cytochrome family protein
MKTTKKSLLLTLTLALFATYGYAQGSMVGTAHDFSAEGWTTATRTCVVCHIAHNSSVEIDAPLWNRTDPYATASGAVFTPYTSPTFDANDGTTDGTTFTPAAYADYLANNTTLNDGTGIWTPNGTSLLCLSCHDGVGNLDAFGGTTGGTAAYAIAAGATKITRVEALRNNGTGEHPFSFTYSDALVAQDHLGTTNPGLYPLATVQTAGLLSGVNNDEIQCTSCHDVHNSGGAPTAVGLLIVPNTGSALCRTCHTK